MHFTTLAQWLDWQTSLHPREIELGLNRCRTVAQRLNLLSPAFSIISVAGTNGKGSSVALLDAILSAAGYRIGHFTSPHLLRYNERICIAGQQVSDAQICHAFHLIEQVRGNISLTFFEFSTLAAMWVFQHSNIDLAVLEVGLGGRLDAVNIFDAEIALITAIDIDHVDWLGHDRESIGFEKAGIFRKQRPAVCSDPNPPLSLIKHAKQLQVPLYYQGHDFTYTKNPDNTWFWQCHIPQQLNSKVGELESVTYSHLPMPSLPGEFQLQNAAGVLMALQLLSKPFSVSESVIQQGLMNANILARFQILPGKVTRILDVAHNPLAAQVLNQSLHQHPCKGKTYAVVGMLKDKDIAGVFTVMQNSITHWHVAPLHVPRGADIQCLVDNLNTLGIKSIQTHPSISKAYTYLLSHAQDGDRIVVFGSFYTVAEILSLEKT